MKISSSLPVMLFFINHVIASELSCDPDPNCWQKASIDFCCYIDTRTFGYMNNECPMPAAVNKKVHSVYSTEDGLMCSIELYDYSWYDLISHEVKIEKDYWFPCNYSDHYFSKGSTISGILSYEMTTDCIGCNPGTQYKCNAQFEIQYR